MQILLMFQMIQFVFVEKLRLEDSAPQPDPSTSDGRNDKTKHRDLTAAEKVVVQAERLKAVVEPPKGNDSVNLCASLNELIQEMGTSFSRLRGSI